MTFISLHGRKFGYNENGLLFDGRPVGSFTPLGPKGKVFFVDSAVAASDGTSPDTALGTLDQAVVDVALTSSDGGEADLILHSSANSHGHVLERSGG